MTPKRPLLIYDGDCGFCRRWVERWRLETADAVDYAPAQTEAARHPDIPAEDFRGSVQLLEGGRRYSGAQAVFRLLAKSPGGGLWLKAYERAPLVAPVSEWFYALVARRRALFSRLTFWLWGDALKPPAYEVSRRLFLRLLGLVYLAAFGSFWGQAAGLVGSRGIVPFPAVLGEVHARLGARAYALLPTLLWLRPTDGALRLVCAAGTGLSALLIADVAPGLIALALWALYLSLVLVGSEFMSFQWDMLLIEAGFLAVFFAPWRLRPFPKKEVPASLGSRVLMRALIFRLMFESGWVKLLSGDSAWRDLTALYYHYQTQPLPTWIGWYAHQLPHAVQSLSTAVMFAIELGAPCLFLLPRRPRMAAASAVIVLMALIALTGNYCFFNLLTAALCLPMFDDAFWSGLLSPRLLKRLRPEPAAAGRGRGRRHALAAAPLLLAGGLQVIGLFEGRLNVPSWLAAGFEVVESLRLVNSYGLFAVMTKNRVEISVEGSDDGRTWREYPFKWKPGPLDRRPGFVEPLQPRLDWQMWFAALGSYQDNPWLLNFLARLLQGEPAALGLLAGNPFPQGPPRYLRALAYEYRFTTFAERRATGDWWKRELKGLYCPVIEARPRGT